MKDDEIQKMLLDLRTDNIRQERELFKHIAILSSAIIGIFAFSGNKDLSIYSKIGILGLFVVIIISVILLFFVLTLERYRAVKAQKIIEDVKKIKNETVLRAITNIFSLKNIDLIEKLIKGQKVSNISENIIFSISKFWQDLTSGDCKINEKKLDLRNAGENVKDIFYRILSYVGIFIFIISLGFITFDILN